MAKGKRVMETIQTTVAAAIDTAFSGLQSIGEEVREAYDNMPESLQGSERGQKNDEIANVLEGLSEIDVPNELSLIPVVVSHPKLRKDAKRHERAEDYLDYARAAIQALEDHKATLQQTKQRSPSDLPMMDFNTVLMLRREYWDADAGVIGRRVMELLDAGEANLRIEDDRGGSDHIIISVPISTIPDEAKDLGELSESLDSLIEEVQQLVDEAEGIDW